MVCLVGVAGLVGVSAGRLVGSRCLALVGVLPPCAFASASAWTHVTRQVSSTVLLVMVMVWIDYSASRVARRLFRRDGRVPDAVDPRLAEVMAHHAPPSVPALYPGGRGYIIP